MDLFPVLKRTAAEDAARFKNFAIVTNHIEICNTAARIFLSWSDDSSDYKEKLRLDRIKNKFCGLNWHLEFPTLEEILEQFYPNFPQTTSSLSQCYPSLTRLAVYATAMRNDQNGLLTFLRYLTQEQDQLVEAAVDCIPTAWNCVGALPGLCEAYCTAIRYTRSKEVHYVARINLAKLLDRSFSQNDPDNEKIFQMLIKLFPTLFPGDRRLSKTGLIARTTLGGWALVAAVNSTSEIDLEDFKAGFKVWGCWLTWGVAASTVRTKLLIIPQSLFAVLTCTGIRSTFCCCFRPPFVLL